MGCSSAKVESYEHFVVSIRIPQALCSRCGRRRAGPERRGGDEPTSRQGKWRAEEVTASERKTHTQLGSVAGCGAGGAAGA